MTTVLMLYYFLLMPVYRQLNMANLLLIISYNNSIKNTHKEEYSTQ